MWNEVTYKGRLYRIRVYFKTHKFLLFFKSQWIVIELEKFDEVCNSWFNEFTIKFLNSENGYFSCGDYPSGIYIDRRLLMRHLELDDECQFKYYMNVIAKDIVYYLDSEKTKLKNIQKRTNL